MKVTVERAHLLKSLNHVHRVVERRNTIPILSNVLLSATGASLVFLGVLAVYFSWCWSSTEAERRERKMAMIMAKPTTTPAAATTMTIWPMWVASTRDSVVRRSGGESNTMIRSAKRCVSTPSLHAP